MLLKISECLGKTNPDNRILYFLGLAKVSDAETGPHNQMRILFVIKLLLTIRFKKKLKNNFPFKFLSTP